MRQDILINDNKRRFGDFIEPYWEELQSVHKDSSQPIYLLDESRTGIPTLKLRENGKELYIHSKYNPIQEANRMVQQIGKEVQGKNHIIFVGVGLGYQIESMLKQFPDKQYTIIEPKQEIFMRFLESRELHAFPFQKLQALYIESEILSLDQFLISLSTQLKGDAFVYVHPVYERIFKEEISRFYNSYQGSLKSTLSNVAATNAFSKRWVINSLMNLRKTLKTQNIREKMNAFKGKSIIIAAAGPSLYEDLEHLKYIKENGLAYIFAVGSANKAFMAQGIIPDAVVTYDPQPHNINVFKELMASGRTDIPMIYGTSVGFETIEAYPGPLFHVVNSADTVTNFYLGRQANEFDVHDSTTITLVAIQIAELLEAGTIILSGQNLAFKNERYYADGIEHGEWKGEVREEREGLRLTVVKDVYGNEVQSNESLNNMRRDIELYIEGRPHLNVINTTKGGADIKGAPFKLIEDVIVENFSNQIVVVDWYKKWEIIYSERVRKQVQKMERSFEKLYGEISKIQSILQKLDALKRTNKTHQINKLFNEFDKQFDRILGNVAYTRFVSPILQFEFENLNKTIQSVYTEQDQVKKIETITTIHLTFIKLIQVIVDEMIIHAKTEVHPKVIGGKEGLKLYRHNDGVFHYEDDWERESLSFDDLSREEHIFKIGRTISTKSSKKGAKITFRFRGTLLRIFAQTHDTFSNDIRITIDGIEHRIRTKDHKVSGEFAPKLNEMVFKVNTLKNDIHDVCIELMSDEAFHFQGIEISEDGRVYHVDEVTKVEELKIGKRIRCNYKATYNKVGEFNALGEASAAFIPVESTPNPDGDFYFIMVDNINGEKKLIADRNVQNYISFDTLKEKLPDTKLAGIRNSSISLLQVSEKENGVDEWLKYIRDNSVVEDSELMWNHGRNVDEYSGMNSFIKYRKNEVWVYSKFFSSELNIFNISRCAKVSNVPHPLWGFRPQVLLY